ncbi:MAG: MFS family permease [Alphaproteobacteria bacterium]
MSSSTEVPKPARVQMMVYAVAFFTSSQFLMLSVVMPLWALSLGATPLMLGLIISSRQILVVVLSIHGGALLDRFGPRVVIVITCLSGAVLLAIYPWSPIIWVTVILQLVSGWFEVTSWIGTQALVARLLGGAPLYAGRMTAVARVGGFCGPILAGLAWARLGPVWGFSFIAAWTFIGAVVACFLPPTPPVSEAPSVKVETAPLPAPGAPETMSLETARPKAERRSVLPSFADYATTFRLLGLPAVALVVCCTFMRQAGSGVQSSFYGVWLNQIGFDAAAIGLLIGISNGVSAFAALSVGWATRYCAAHWLLIGMTILAIAGIAITPVLGTFIALAIAMGLRGLGQGYNFPLMLSISTQAVGQHLQGRVVALRISFNKFGGAMVPFIMGAIAEVTSIEFAFYLIGSIGIVALMGLGVWAGLSPAFKNTVRND